MNNTCAQRWRFDPLPSLWYLIVPFQTLETASEALQDTVSVHKATESQDFQTASARANSKADLEDSSHDGVALVKRRRHCDFLINTNRI
ncbi:hypothetical protein Tco_0760961 [Tanacetum coccineum]